MKRMMKQDTLVNGMISFWVFALKLVPRGVGKTHRAKIAKMTSRGWKKRLKKFAIPSAKHRIMDRIPSLSGEDTR